MILWIAMLLTQAWFVRSRQMDLHRLVGKASYVVIPLAVLSALVVAQESLQRETEIDIGQGRIAVFN